MVENPLFVPGQVYRRRDLHARWGGQRQGGISTPSQHNLILLFTGEAAKQHGYRDELSDDGIFLYTGEGQRGDMQFLSGNRAIRDHALNGKDLHLFKQCIGSLHEIRLQNRPLTRRLRWERFFEFV